MLYLLTISNYLCIELQKTNMGIKLKAKLSSTNFKSILLLLLFAGSFISNNFYLHTHQINGTIVFHSHPFTAEAQHQHSGSSAELIQQLNHTNFNFDNNVVVVSFIEVFLYKLNNKHYSADKLANNNCKLFNRPPPILA